MQIICANCGFSNSPTNLYCGQCGQQLQSPTTKKELSGLTDLVDEIYLSSKPKSYPGLSVVMIFLFFFGWLSMLIGGTVGLMKFAEFASLNSHGKMQYEAWTMPSETMIPLYLATVSFLIGFGMVTFAESIKLMMDMQATNDKHTRLLYALFRVTYLSERNVIHERHD